MRLAKAIEDYVARRRSTGSSFVSSAAILQAFLRSVGDVDLRELSAGVLSAFVERPGRAQTTKLSNYSVLSCFLRDCTSQGFIDPLRIQAPTKPARPREPFIYTHAQVRLLLATAHLPRRLPVEIEGQTFRLLLLFLYGTGCGLDEALGLKWADCNLVTGTVVFAGSWVRSARSIPIGPQLVQALDQHHIEGSSESYIFQTQSGTQLSRRNLFIRFRRLLRTAKISHGAEGSTPRLQDLRFTFAVHRLQTWVTEKRDLNVLIPALSAYMGYASLTKAECFLAHVPTRFISDLRKLSPSLVGIKE